jgi:hypothetical protein
VSGRDGQRPPRLKARAAGAAICPSAPLLARELTGRDPVVPDLRRACAAAVARLAGRGGSGPGLMAVVGAGPGTATWPEAGRLNLGAFAPALADGDRGLEPRLPWPLGLGARLLDEAGYTGPRLLQSAGEDEPAEACLAIGADLAERGAGLLVMADGSARRSVRAPGYLDPRAEGLDATLERAVRGGDPGALRDLDPGLAAELLVADRSAWQVLAGAMPGPVPAAEVLYTGDPFGVFYLVAWLA